MVKVYTDLYIYIYIYIYRFSLVQNNNNFSIVVQVHDSPNVQTDANPSYETSTAVNNTVLYETVF